MLQLQSLSNIPIGDKTAHATDGLQNMQGEDHWHHGYVCLCCIP